MTERSERMSEEASFHLNLHYALTPRTRSDYVDSHYEILPPQSDVIRRLVV